MDEILKTRFRGLNSGLKLSMLCNQRYVTFINSAVDRGKVYFYPPDSKSLCRSSLEFKSFPSTDKERNRSQSWRHARSLFLPVVVLSEGKAFPRQQSSRFIKSFQLNHSHFCFVIDWMAHCLTLIIFKSAQTRASPSRTEIHKRAAQKLLLDDERKSHISRLLSLATNLSVMTYSWNSKDTKMLQHRKNIKFSSSPPSIFLPSRMSFRRTLLSYRIKYSYVIPSRLFI